MAYEEPKGKILKITSQGNVIRSVIEFDRLPIEPIAPGGLYSSPKSGTQQFQLHRLVSSEMLTLTFETFVSAHPPPKAGEIYSFKSWWLPEAMDAALDREEQWVKKYYPDNGDHEHCLFTWATIASCSENPVGYYSEKYGWITCDSYHKYIEGDIYHLRDTIN